MRYFIIPVTSLEAHGWQAPQAQLTRTYTKSAVNLVANETGCSCTTSTKVQNVYLISWNHVCWGAGWTDGREWGVLVWSKKCGPFDILDTLELLFSHRNLPSHFHHPENWAVPTVDEESEHDSPTSATSLACNHSVGQLTLGFAGKLWCTSAAVCRRHMQGLMPVQTLGRCWRYRISDETDF